MLEKKKEALPDLRTAMQEAQSRYEEAKLAREQRTKVNTLKQEIAWAHVKSKEEDLERAFAEVAKVERNIPKLIERRDAAQAKFEALGDQLVLLEQESVDYGSSDDLKARKKEIIDELKALDFKSRALDRDITQMNKDMKGQRESIVTFDAQIEQETRKLEAQAAGRQEQLRQQLEDASNALKAAEEEARALNVQIGEQDEAIRSVANRGKAAENAVDGIKRELSNIQATIDGAKRAAGNKYAVYGPGMGQAVNAIRGARWHGETPVGPLGEFVKLRDRTWGDLVRNIIGSRMYSFAVTDARDRNQLKQILDKYQW
jgi:chromosome segregation ATPase